MTSTPASGARLAIRIWLGIGALFAVLAVAVSLSLAGLLVSHRALRRVGDLAAAEREAVAVGVAAREQYMHQSHGALLQDARHLGHEQKWAQRLEQHSRALRPMVGGSQRAQLATIEAESTALSRIFAKEIFPAAVAGDLGLVRSAHDRAARHLAMMTHASDAAVAELAELNATAAGAALITARRASIAAMAVTLAAATIALLLAIGFVRRIAQPVSALGLAASRIGEGDFGATVPATGTREFDELARAVHQMAERLRDRENELLRAERLATLGTLAAGVAHELNNPLAVILGYAKTIRKETDPAVIADELRILEDEAQLCRRIVEDLVTFAREPRLDLEVLDVSALVRETCERLRATGEMSEHETHVEAPHEILVDADRKRIAQVLRNLVLNAGVASPSGERIDLAVDRADNHAVIHVRDRGTGIDASDLPHLFEPFFSRRPGGTGLGLSVSHGIVRSHGGTIEVESKPGKGTTVIVRLPLHQATA